MKNLSLKILAFLTLIFISLTAKAQTYYYIGGDGATANFLSAVHWSNTLGGPAVASISSTNATYIIDGSDVSSTAGTQPGATVTFSLNANTAMGNLIVQNNNINVTITSINYTFGIANDITVNSGCTLSNQISQPAIIGGNMVNNGTLTYGTNQGEYTFNGVNKTISGSNTTQFRKITIGAGAYISLQRDIDITGNLTSFINGTLNAQTFLIKEVTAATANITLAAAGLLRTSNPLGVRGQTGATIDPNLTLNMSTGNTIEFCAANGTQDIWCGNSITYYHNILISGGGTKRLVNNAAQWIDIRGSITIGSGNTLDVSATGDATNIKDIEFDENFTNNGTFLARTNTVTIAGSGGTQVLTMNGSSLYDLELANPTSNAASLGSDAILTHALTFANGRLLLGNYNFTFDINALSPVGGTNLKMLVTNGNGEVKKVVAAGGGQFTYAIGEITGTAEYSPVTLNFTANSAVRTVGIRVVDSQHPNDNTITDYLSRYWHYSVSPLTGTYTYNSVYTFPSGDVVGTAANLVNSYIYLPNTIWTGLTTTSTNTSMTVNGTTQLLNGAEVTGRVTAGCVPPSQPGAFTTSSASVCAGTNGVTYSVPNDPSVTYTWTYSGTGATINGTGNSVTVNFASNATGGDLSVTAVNGCNSTPRSITVTVNQNVGTPSFSLGATTLCAGGTSTYTATASNSSSITYSIVNNSGATINPNTGAVSNVTGNFTVRATATGTCGNPTTADRAVTVTPTVGTPVFTAGSITMCVGGTSTYTATASNSTGVTYSIVGNFGATINPSTGVVSNVTDNFTVRATATGACGGPTTTDRVVNVIAATTVVTQPMSSFSCENRFVSFFISTNDANATYQWLFNNSPIQQGATGASYGIAAVHPADQGAYSVVATGTCGSDTSDIATLTVVPSQYVEIFDNYCIGGTYNFNGQILNAPGVYFDTLIGQNSCDSLVSLTLSINDPEATALLTGNANLSVAQQFVGYQWVYNGVLIDGATTPTYTATQNGDYSVIITDALGCTDTSNIVTVTALSLAEELQLFTIYPNPATQNVFIKAENVPVGEYTLTLTDVTGRVLSQRSLAIGNAVIEQINITSLAKGMYMLTVSTNSLKQTYRLVKAE